MYISTYMCVHLYTYLSHTHTHSPAQTQAPASKCGHASSGTAPRAAAPRQPEGVGFRVWGAGLRGGGRGLSVEGGEYRV